MSVARFAFTDRARPLIEVGIGDTRTMTGALWDVDRWDTGRWAGTEPAWYDISCDVLSAATTYGRQSTTDRFIAGVASIVVNNRTGWADPDTSDPPGVLTLRPGRPVRISVVHQVHGLRVLFRGFIDAMEPAYDPVELDTVTLACVDALGEVNRAKLVPVEPPVGDGDWASARIDRILDAIAWFPRDTQPSSEVLIGTDLGGQVADLLGRTADSAGGSVFGDMDGRIAFRPRDWQAFPTGTPPDATIGNGQSSSVPADVVYGADDVVFGTSDVVFGAGAAADVCPVRFERPFARADITTRAIIGRDAETAVQVDDHEAAARYGIEPFTRTDLLTASDASLTLIAERILATRGEATAPRVRSVTLDARTADNALDLMATVDVYRPSRYRCRLQYPPPRGVVFDADYFATGVAHQITPEAWTLDLNLDVAAPFEADGGRWDDSAWDLAYWVDPLTVHEDTPLIGAS